MLFLLDYNACTIMEAIIQQLENASIAEPYSLLVGIYMKELYWCRALDLNIIRNHFLLN